MTTENGAHPDVVAPGPMKRTPQRPGVPLTKVLLQNAGSADTLIRAVTQVGREPEAGWPSLGGGDADDADWIIRAVSVRHMLTPGALPDLDEIAWYAWMLPAAIDGRRTSEVVAAYGARMEPSSERRSAGGGDPPATRGPAVPL